MVSRSVVVRATICLPSLVLAFDHARIMFQRRRTCAAAKSSRGEARTPVTSLQAMTKHTTTTTTTTNDAITGEQPPLRILLNGGDNMLGRAVQLTCVHQSIGDDMITDSCRASHYLDMSINHPSSSSNDPTRNNDLDLKAIRKLNEHGEYLWGDYLNLIIQPPPDLRILNLETAVTSSINERDAPQYKLQYHFHEDNLEPVLSAYQRVQHGGWGGMCDDNNKSAAAAGGAKDDTTTDDVGPSRSCASPVVVTFANNHCFDMGKTAFVRETIPRFRATEQSTDSSIKFIGAGLNRSEAMKPTKYPLTSSSNIVVFAVGSSDSGIPESWAAQESSAGAFWIPELASKARVSQAFDSLKEAITKHSNPEQDIIIVSIHSGPNWAYRHPSDAYGQVHRRALAHRLVDECGVDLIYGHSSHHVRGMEVYNGKCILYGTGDLINDYEGFSNPGEERYNTFGAIILADLSRTNGDLVDLHIIPTFMDRLSLRRWTPTSKVWNPNTRRMEPTPHGAEEMCAFVNDMTSRDAASSDTALQLAVCKESSVVPGGPILRWDKKKGASSGGSSQA